MYTRSQGLLVKGLLITVNEMLNLFQALETAYLYCAV